MNRLIQISITAFLCFSCACLSAQSLELNDLLVREGVLVTGTDGSVTNTSLLQIRGANALRGSSEPLIILDGAVLNPYLLETGNAFWQYSEAAYNNVQNSLMGLNPADIERIEVLRDLSATALYGQAGANGVIIITTKMASEREHRITWSSHLELSTPVLGKTPMRGLEEGANALSTAAGPSLSHRHDFSVSARRNKLNYLFSGFLHDVNGTLEGNGATVGGLRVNFDVNANKTLSFGMRMGVSLADTDAGLYAGRVGTGTGSIAMLTTAADSTEPDAYASWRSDYDDHAREYRAMPSMWINIKFLEGLNLRTEAGADYRDKSRAFWYGNGLSFGRAHNGAAAVSSFTTLSYNASSALCLDKQWGAHALVMKAGVDAYGYFDNQNTLNGTDFFAHELRAKGLNLAGRDRKSVV